MAQFHILYSGVGGTVGGSALVLAVPQHLDIALLSPIKAPGILDEPVLLAASLVGAVANCGHAVVKVCVVASRIVIDTCKQKI